MFNLKNKMILSASIMAIADLLAIIVVGYVGFTTTNLLVVIIMAALALIFAYDIVKALQFIKAMIKNK